MEVLLGYLVSAGEWARRSILELAGGLVEDWVPGAVAIGLVVLLLVATLWLWSVTYRRRAAIRWLTRILRSAADEAAFYREVTEIDRKVATGKAASGVRNEVATAWQEYRETLVPCGAGSERWFGNAARPAVFFNSDDLRFGPGFFRAIPGLFVSCGLLLTFLGLIAALNAMQVDTDTETALQTLLTVVSAKFIMSLTGLACSILFTIALRWAVAGMDRSLSELNGTIEARLRYVSLERVAEEQLHAVRENRDTLRQVALEMTADLKRPLEAIPTTVASSISEAIGPLIERVSAQGTAGVGTMVSDLSARLSGDVGRALSVAGERLSAAAERLDRSSARMGEEMTSALEAIRARTEAGAAAIAGAATAMEKAAVLVKEELTQAAGQGAEVARQQIAAAGQAAAEHLGGTAKTLMEPVEAVAVRLGEMAAALQDGQAAMGHVASQAERLARATEAGTEAFRGSAGAMADAAAPLRGTAERIEGAVRRSGEAAAAAAASVRQSSEAVAQRSAEVLAAADLALGGHAKAIAATLAALQQTLDRVKGQGDRLDELDDKLGNAFRRYAETVEQDLSTLETHVRRMQDHLAPAVDTLRNVVEQAQSFRPEQVSV